MYVYMFKKNVYVYNCLNVIWTNVYVNSQDHARNSFVISSLKNLYKFIEKMRLMTLMCRIIC
jgi:hypothetical protein